MASYLVLTPPGAARSDERARFIHDGFAWLGFAFPSIWLLTQRQWIAGIVVGLLQIAIAIVLAAPEAMVAGFLVELALRLLVALEGPAFVARRLESAGWTLRDIIPVSDLTTAEMIYDSQEDAMQTNTPAFRHPDLQPEAMVHSGSRPAFGLFGSYGER